MTDHSGAYLALTPYGAVDALFPEDGGCVLNGPAAAVAHIQQVMRTSANHKGMSMTLDSIEPNDFFHFCQPEGTGIMIFQPAAAKLAALLPAEGGAAATAVLDAVGKLPGIAELRAEFAGAPTLRKLEIARAIWTLRQAAADPSKGGATADAAAPPAVTGTELGVFDEDKAGFKLLKAAAVAYYRTVLRDEAVPCPALQDVVVLRRRGMEHLLNVGATRDSLRLFPIIPALITSATLVAHKKPVDKPQNITDYYVLRSKAKLGDRELFVRLVVERDNNGKLLYDLAINKNALEVPPGDSASLDSCTDPSQLQGVGNSVASNGEPRKASAEAVLDAADGAEVLNLLIEGGAPEMESDISEDGPQVPDGVRRRVEGALASLRDVAAAVDRARDLEANVGGTGRYQAETLANRASDIEAARATLAEFRRVAPGNGIDAEAFLASLGGESDLTPSKEAADWMTRDAEPAPASEPAPSAADHQRTADEDLLAQVIAGTHEDMLEPELLERLEGMLERYTGDEVMQEKVNKAIDAASQGPDRKEIAAAEAAAAREDAREFLQSVIEGKEDVTDPVLNDRLVAVVTAYAEDAELMALADAAITAMSKALIGNAESLGR